MGVVIKCSIFFNLEMKGYMEDTQMKIKRVSKYELKQFALS